MERPHRNELLETFATYLVDQRGLAPGTVKGQVTAVRHFLALAQREPEALLLPTPFEPATVDKRALEIYLKHLRQSRGLAESSVAGQLRTLRGFFGWLEDVGRIARNPARSLVVTVHHEPKNLPEGGAEAVRRMFATGGNPLRAARLGLLLELFYGGGLPPATCYAIKQMDIDKASGALRITTESAKREVLISREGLDRAERYLALRAEILALSMETPARFESGAVPSVSMEDEADIADDQDKVGLEPPPFWINGRGAAFSAGALGRQVRRAMERVGLVGGPSSLRRLGARHFREQGADVRSVQQFLGAKRLGRIDRYQTREFRDVAAAFRRAHPREDT